MVKIGMSKDVREIVTIVRKCDSPKEVCQLVRSKGDKVYHLA